MVCVAGLTKQLEHNAWIVDLCPTVDRKRLACESYFSTVNKNLGPPETLCRVLSKMLSMRVDIWILEFEAEIPSLNLYFF